MSAEDSHEALWAREGDEMRAYWESGQPSPFSSLAAPEARSEARVRLHGFDFRVETDRGRKTMVRL